MAYTDKYSDDIKTLCDLHKVKTLYVLGSAVYDQLSEKSDVDFMVDFQTMDLEIYADNYFNLKFSLQQILKRPIDLVEEKLIKNPYFKQAVNNQSILILLTLLLFTSCYTVEKISESLTKKHPDYLGLAKPHQYSTA